MSESGTYFLRKLKQCFPSDSPATQKFLDLVETHNHFYELKNKLSQIVRQYFKQGSSILENEDIKMRMIHAQEQLPKLEEIDQLCRGYIEYYLLHETEIDSQQGQRDISVALMEMKESDLLSNSSLQVVLAMGSALDQFYRRN